MNNNENRKTPEELTEEMLDAVSGGDGAIDQDPAIAWAVKFGINNCMRCTRMLTGSCCYRRGPVDVYETGMDASGTCPGLTT